MLLNQTGCNIVRQTTNLQKPLFWAVFDYRISVYRYFLLLTSLDLYDSINL